MTDYQRASALHDLVASQIMETCQPGLRDTPPKIFRECPALQPIARLGQADKPDLFKLHIREVIRILDQAYYCNQTVTYRK